MQETELVDYKNDVSRETMIILQMILCMFHVKQFERTICIEL